MKLLLDQGAPRTAATLLRQAGFDTVHTGEINLAQAADEEILKYALRENRMVVTLDADFHRHLAFSQARQPSVIRVRVEGLKAVSFAELIQGVLQQCAEDLKAGALLSVTEGQIRVRRLPVV